MSRGMRFAAAVAGLALLAACGLQEPGLSSEAAAMMTGGDPGRGRSLVRAYGCGSCHTVPGVPGADSQVGPPLAGLAGRMYIAGVLPNQPENLVRWILDPPAVDSLTAMPNLGASERDARDLAAYLYTLE